MIPGGFSSHGTAFKYFYRLRFISFCHFDIASKGFDSVWFAPSNLGPFPLQKPALVLAIPSEKQGQYQYPSTNTPAPIPNNPAMIPLHRLGEAIQQRSPFIFKFPFRDQALLA